MKLDDVHDTLPTTVELVTPSHKIKKTPDPKSVALTVFMQTIALPRIEKGGYSGRPPS